jgi:hypothetical protein
MISKPMVRLAQIIYVSCVKISTISKRIETSFHLSLMTLEYHWVHPKWLLSLLYIRCKPCSYLKSRLTLSPNGPKQASTWASSPRRTVEYVQNDFNVWRKQCAYLTLTLTSSPYRPKQDLTWSTSPRNSIGCDQNDFQAYGTFVINNVSNLGHDWHYLQTDQNELPLEPHHLGVPSGVSKMIMSLWYVWRKPCTYLALTLTPSPNGPKQDLTWPTFLGVPSGTSKMFLSLWYIQRKPCNYLATRLALSPNRPKTSFH